VAALLQASPNRTHRAILATAIMAGGLRVSELTGLRRSDLNLAHSTLTVRGTKTAAADRTVELPPDLRDELAAYVAGHQQAPDDWLFPGRGGQRRDRNAVRRRVLYPAIERANDLLASRELPAISADVTFHSLRRTYASLAAEAGADPAWTAAQIGHARSRFTLDVYTDVRNRRHSPVERIGALVRGDDWAPLGTSAQADEEVSPAEALDSPLESPQGA
jgi:integrase